MDSVLSSKTLPPGFRFHPTDEELFMYYLKRQLMGKSFCHPMMAEVDVYRYAPWDLPRMSFLKTKDLNWYFLCPRMKKYACGSRANRANEFGFWKSTGNDRTVQYKQRLVGKIKTLIFHRGKAPKGERTDWVIHEYKMEDKALANDVVSLDAYVICKIYQKSGLGPKTGEHYGAPFMEEEWENDDDLVTSVSNTSTALAPSTSGQPTSAVDSSCDSALLSPTIEQIAPAGEEHLACTTTMEQTALVRAVIPSTGTGDELDRLLAMFTADDIPPAANGMVAALEDGFFDGLEDLGTGFHYSSAGLLPLVAVPDNARQIIEQQQYIELDDLMG